MPKTAVTKTKNRPPAVSVADQPLPEALTGARVAWALFGPCSTADDLELGAINSTTSVDGWHKLCNIGIVVPSKWQVTLCTHEWHGQNPRCRACRRFHQSAASLDGSSACLDVEECFAHLNEQRANDPRFDKIRAIKEAGARERAANQTERKERRAGVESDGNGRGPARPTTGICHHCGGLTKGGKFIAGHDAKLKGELIREADEGAAEAVAEAMIRGWYKIGRFPDLEATADRLVQERPTGEFIVERNAARSGRHLEES